MWILGKKENLEIAYWQRQMKCREEPVMILCGGHWCMRLGVNRSMVDQTENRNKW